MKFDTIIIGGGLSGLVCGIRLAQKGQRCVIISSGQSALHFSSGSFDLLNATSNNNDISEPLVAVQSLIKEKTNHPYAKIGVDKFKQLAQTAEIFFQSIDLVLQGSSAKNHYRITPMGTMTPTWLTMSDLVISNNKDKYPWSKVSILSPLGFLDFYPEYIVAEFKKKGTECDVQTFNMEALDRLRHNPSEVRSASLARTLDKTENIKELANIISEKCKDCEAVILPACIGLKKDSVSKLSELVNKPVLLITTLPPSSVGIRTQQYLQRHFEKLGGVYMLGDSVIKAEIEDDTVKKVYSYNHGNIPFEGNNIVLATGSYFSQGLKATPDSVCEPIFDLDVSYIPNRQEWYQPNLFAKQSYLEFGVKTDNNFRGLHKGKVLNNLYVSGAILEGFNPIKEGSGGGVSILSALHIAENILNK